MKSTLYFVLLVWALEICCDASLSGSDNMPNPVALIPVGLPKPFEKSYEGLIQGELCAVNGDYGRFISLPDSFLGDISVSVRGPGTSPEIDKRKNYYITVIQERHNLDEHVSDLGYGNKAEPIVEKRTDTLIDRELAEAIRGAWTAMLLKNRKPPKGYYPGFGGNYMRFSVITPKGKYLEGELWNPENNLPATMVGIGFEIFYYTRAHSWERETLRNKLLADLRTFQAKAEKL